ncbi:hypothetical protein BDD12DRAFT_199935 [Trichophaea hybrida]|nr:hypothetical protein BDD12DRAFT_199935 [Trichophaea hybrida]
MGYSVAALSAAITKTLFLFFEVVRRCLGSYGKYFLEQVSRRKKAYEITVAAESACQGDYLISHNRLPTEQVA